MIRDVTEIRFKAMCSLINMKTNVSCDANRFDR